MKVLFAGDTHGDADQVLYLCQTARNHGSEKVFILGDFGAWEHTPAGEEFFDAVDSYAASMGVTVYFLDGNHDKTSLVMEYYGWNRDPEGFVICREHLRYAPRGHRWTWDGRTFMAFGGAYSVDKGPRLVAEQKKFQKAARRERYRRQAGRPAEPIPTFEGTLWFPEEEATDAELDAILEADSTPVDCLLTHDKPIMSSPSYNRKDWTTIPGCEANQRRIQRLVTELRPALVLHGHLHIRYSDQIRSSGDSWTSVVGLHCDPGAGSHLPGYKREDSWVVAEITPKIALKGDPLLHSAE